MTVWGLSLYTFPLNNHREKIELWIIWQLRGHSIFQTEQSVFPENTRRSDMLGTDFTISIFIETTLKINIALETWENNFFERCWWSWYSLTHKFDKTTKNISHWIGREHIPFSWLISGKSDLSVWNVDWPVRSPNVSHLRFYLWS